MKTPHPIEGAQAIFEKRENMGASPLAIQTAEHIREDFDKLYNIQLPPATSILIAAMVDAAIRKSGAPEMLAVIKDLQATLSALASKHKDGMGNLVGTSLFAAARVVSQVEGGSHQANEVRG